MAYPLTQHSMRRWSTFREFILLTTTGAVGPMVGWVMCGKCTVEEEVALDYTTVTLGCITVTQDCTTVALDYTT